MRSQKVDSIFSAHASSPAQKIKAVNRNTCLVEIYSNMKYDYKPSLKELRSSLKYRLREYLLQNPLHGVPYFMDSTRPKWERVTWFLLTVASIIAISVIIAIIAEKIQTEPTITGLDVAIEDIHVDFPQIFICFDWARLNHFNLQKNELHIYEQLYNWTWGTDIHFESVESVYKNKNNVRDIFKRMAPDCNNVISNCVYKNVTRQCSDLVTSVLVTVGACCKLTIKEPLKITDPSWYLEFETQSSYFPWRFYFTHYMDSSPQPGERSAIKTYFPAVIEFVADITYTTPEIRSLRIRQRECYYRDEGVSFNDCEIHCFINTIFKYCNCLPWFLSSVDKIECSLSKYSCLNTYTIDTKMCNCWLSCDHTTYTVRRVTKSVNNINRIMLGRWPLARYKREMRFGYLDLLVSFGGVASLFLGYSLIISFEFGYYFSLRTYCGAVIESSRKQCNIVTVHVIRKRPQKLDIIPRYYQYID